MFKPFETELEFAALSKRRLFMDSWESSIKTRMIVEIYTKLTREPKISRYDHFKVVGRQALSE